MNCTWTEILRLKPLRRHLVMRGERSASTTASPTSPRWRSCPSCQTLTCGSIHVPRSSYNNNNNNNNKYPCAQVIFDSDPAPAGVAPALQNEQMGQAMIRGGQFLLVSGVVRDTVFCQVYCIRAPCILFLLQYDLIHCFLGLRQNFPII